MGLTYIQTTEMRPSIVAETNSLVYSKTSKTSTLPDGQNDAGESKYDLDLSCKLKVCVQRRICFHMVIVNKEENAFNKDQDHK